MTATPETIGARIRRLRTEKGLSLRALAIPEQRISFSALRLYETGERNVSRDVVQILARRLGVSAYYLETGYPDAVYVLVRRYGPNHDELVAAFRDKDMADTWADRCQKGDPKSDYTTFYVPIDDANTLALFAAERFTKEVPE